MRDSFWNRFADPPNPFRAKPLWAWNGRLAEPELRRQIRIFRRMGFGGFFIHPRVGLATPYLSKAWFERLQACVNEAEKAGLEVWLYDEYGWPSGRAGGLATRRKRHRMRKLSMQVITHPSTFSWATDTVAVFSARLGRAGATDLRRVVQTSHSVRPPRGRALLVFRVTQSSNYIDALNPAAVREFIKVTHQAYARRVGRYFGRRIPGIFTDEPLFGELALNSVDQPVTLPWTDRLPSVFRRRYGYDLRDHLPELCFDTPAANSRQTRFHYFDCLTHLFTRAFARSIGAWCARHGILFTGHVPMEDNLTGQTSATGSVMRFYEHMQAPGMDLLTDNLRLYDTAKQVSSTARQFGRRWRLTETDGCTGWDFPLAGRKALGDWQIALGLNLRAPHMAWYTMRGEAKRDYPASISFQSPWWPVYARLETYFARIHTVMMRGREVRDLLVIHPVESMWTLCRLGWRNDPQIRAFENQLPVLRDILLTHQIDFDYGDEEILSRIGRCIRQDGAPVLQAGQAVYKAVLVPPMITMRASTLRLLCDFREAGGKVVFAGQIAEWINAQASTAVRDLAQRCERVALSRSVIAAVEPACRRVSITDPAGGALPAALYLLREDRRAFYLFVCNTGHSRRQLKPRQRRDVMVYRRKTAYPDVRIHGLGQGVGRPIELDPATGRYAAARAVRTGAGWEIRTSLPALGSRLFMIPKAGGVRPPPRVEWKTIRTVSLSRNPWQIRLTEPNVLVLDRPRYRIGSGPWHPATEILQVDGAVRRTCGMISRYASTIQPWTRAGPGKTARVRLAFTFDVQQIPSGDLYLALEQPTSLPGKDCLQPESPKPFPRLQRLQRKQCGQAERRSFFNPPPPFQICLNGVDLAIDMDCGWWVDPSLRRLPLDPAALHIGTNELVLEGRYHEFNSGLEAVYLLGGFGVKLAGAGATLTPAPTGLRWGDWRGQGLPFYSGTVIYGTTIRPACGRDERIYLHVPAYAGAALRALVDGREAGVIAWEPNETDLTAALASPGPTHDLQIEVFGSRRNSHGPLHHTARRLTGTGPNVFVSAGAYWQEGYQGVPGGLMRPPGLLVKAACPP